MTTTTYTREEILANRSLWADALESGKYSQTTGQLAYSEDERKRNFDYFEIVHANRPEALADAKARLDRDNPVGFCCLGVACEVAVEAGIIESYEHSDGGPPVEVAEWLGFGYDGADYLGDTTIFDQFETFLDPHPTDLASLNDTYNLTLAEIAAIVRDEDTFPITTLAPHLELVAA